MLASSDSVHSDGPGRRTFPPILRRSSSFFGGVCLPYGEPVLFDLCHRAWPSTVLAVVAGLSFAAGRLLSTTPAALQFVPCYALPGRGHRDAAGRFGGPELSAGTSRSFDIPAECLRHPWAAVAYSLNVTVVPDGFLSYLTFGLPARRSPTSRR